ncbi:MAG: hypothetical protein AB7P37_03270 [Ramlibacter sp.]
MTHATRLARLNAKALDRFGVEHTVAGNPVQGDFARPGQLMNMGDGMEIRTTKPALVIATSDVPANPVGQAVVAVGEGGGNFQIVDLQGDGHGLTALYLKKA